MLKAVVVVPNEKMIDEGDVFAEVRNVVRKREKNVKSPCIMDIKYHSKLHVYIAIYETDEFPVRRKTHRVKMRFG